jgi:flavin reductase (DIM6/NTAB) family NADH-FMN oxidoreductase RutF
MVDQPSPSPYLAAALVDNAVALVTSAHQDRVNVMTVTFFAESSHVPLLVRIAISPTCWTHELVAASGWFGLSILVRQQAPLALACGSCSGRTESKFARLGIPYWLTEQGVPLLPHSLATSACRVLERIDLPDHTLFVGEILSSFRRPAWATRDALLVSDLVEYLRS